MKVKMQVLGFGESSFTSPKNGRVYNRARLMGMVFDPYDGTQVPATADLGFDSQPLSESPKTGGMYLLDCTDMSMRNAMLSFTFTILAPFLEKSEKLGK